MRKKKFSKRKSKRVKNKTIQYLDNAFNGGIIFSTLFLIITLLGKIGLLKLNFLFDTYGKLGYDISFFGILLGIIYGFITGFILFFSYSILKNSIKK